MWDELEKKVAYINSGGLHQDIATDVWGPPPHFCVCRVCSREIEVNAGECLRSGWPKCCGRTMTVKGGGDGDDAA